MERNQTRVRRATSWRRFASDGADADKDQRVSLLEAFEYARREVARFYEKGQLLATEHAVLDDDGDGTGTWTRTRRGRRRDGADACSSAAARRAAGGGGGGAAIRALAAPAPGAARDRAEARGAESAQGRRWTPAQYEDELEALLLELALKDEAIRAGAREAP